MSPCVKPAAARLTFAKCQTGLPEQISCEVLSSGQICTRPVKFINQAVPCQEYTYGHALDECRVVWELTADLLSSSAFKKSHRRKGLVSPLPLAQSSQSSFVTWECIFDEHCTQLKPHSKPVWLVPLHLALSQSLAVRHPQKLGPTVACLARYQYPYAAKLKLPGKCAT